MPFAQAVIDDYGLDLAGNPIAAGSTIRTPFALHDGVRILFFVSRATRNPTLVTPFTPGVEYELGDAVDVTDCVRGYTVDGFILGANGNAFGSNHSVLIWRDTSPDNRYLRIGTYAGNGAADRQIDVGFTPTHVLVVGWAGWAWKSPEMPAAHCVILANQTTSPVTNGIKAFTATPTKGFTVGNHVDTNQGSVTYVWVALRITPAFAPFFRSFSQAGTGAVGQVVSGFPFAPGFILTKEMATGTSAFLRTPRHSGLESLSAALLTVVTTGIDGIGADRLTLGADGGSAGITVYGFAVPAVPKAGGGVSSFVLTEDTGCQLDFPAGAASAVTACAATDFTA